MILSPHPFGVLFLLILPLFPSVLSFQKMLSQKVTKPRLNLPFPRLQATLLPGTSVSTERSRPSFKSSDQPAVMRTVRPTLADDTRTIAHICKSGTLSTISDQGHPSGTSVDYVLNKKGHPIFFFSKSATSLSNDARASFFCKIPMEYEHVSSLSSKSASIQGELMPVGKKEINSLKIAFSLTHPHCTDNLCQTDDIFFAKLQPANILYSTGDFGAKPIPVDISEYESAFPDILAQEVPTLLPRLNIAKQYELRLLCKHVLNISEDVETVTLQAIDKLGIDIRTIRGECLLSHF
jgi:hypothetical protein